MLQALFLVGLSQCGKLEQVGVSFEQWDSKPPCEEITPIQLYLVACE